MNLFKNLNFEKLKNGLSKTRNKIFVKISETITQKAVIDESVLNEIEEILVTSDLGFDISQKIIDEARQNFKQDSKRSSSDFIASVKKSMHNLLLVSNNKEDYKIEVEKYKPFVIFVVGVNGVGKTTSIGKLAYNFKKNGLNCIIGAADTFRAAANEQLEIWSKRANVDIIQKPSGSDPSSVAFETIQTAISKQFDVVLIDTAGRLHNKANLMEELKKINRVIKSKLNYAPNEVFLILDGTTGQNAIIQTEEFLKVTNITGLIITKLDGSAKGGAVFNICNKFKIPIRYIGIGEGIEDLQNFDSSLFVNALFENNN